VDFYQDAPLGNYQAVQKVAVWD